MAWTTHIHYIYKHQQLTGAFCMDAVNLLLVHSVLSGDSIRQCETSSGSRHKDTDQCLSVAISFCRHCSVLVPCENGSAETTVVEGGRNPVARLWDNTLGENWPPETTSSYASIDFWLRICEVSRFNSNSIQTSRFDSIRKWRADSTISNRRACHVCRCTINSTHCSTTNFNRFGIATGIYIEFN